MRASVPVVLLLVLTLPMLSACGLKDDLYLPEERSDQSAPPPDDEREQENAENPRA